MSQSPPEGPHPPPADPGPGGGSPQQPFSGAPAPQPQQQPQWTPPFQPPYAPAPGQGPAPGPTQRGRLVWVGVLSAVGTLLVAGGITAGAVYVRGDFRPGAQHIHSSLPQDPCASVDDAGLSGLEATESHRYAAVYENRCTWDVDLDGVEGSLSVGYALPMSEADAAVAEEQGEEPTTDPEELFADHRNEITDPESHFAEWSVLEEQESAQDFGDESTLVWTHTQQLEFLVEGNYNADLLIRDGPRVTAVGLRVYGGDGTLTRSDAEPVLKDLVQHVDWQQG